MNLTNKQISVISLSTNMVTSITIAKVNVTQEISSGIFKLVDQYDLTFNDIYTITNDPLLLSAIREKLSLIPD